MLVSTVCDAQASYLVAKVKQVKVNIQGFCCTLFLVETISLNGDEPQAKPTVE